MKCFHDIKTEIGARCDNEASVQYRRNYIQPLVDQTRDTVLSQCTLSPPYEQYFSKAPSLQWRHTNYYRLIVASLAAALFSQFLTNRRHLLYENDDHTYYLYLRTWSKT